MIEYGRRRRRLPAPRHVVFDDLAAPRATGTRAWLDLRDDEVPPEVVDAHRPDHLTWTSMWPGRPDDLVVLELDAGVGADTGLTFTLLAAGVAPDEAETHRIRYRVNTLLWADLRRSYGQ